MLVAHSKLSGQAQRILQLLVEGGSLTPRDAMALHPPIYRLAARVKELREAFGDDAIVTVHERHDGGTHARYVWARSVEPQGSLFAP
jgi:hypothetical protein